MHGVERERGLAQRRVVEAVAPQRADQHGHRRRRARRRRPRPRGSRARERPSGSGEQHRGERERAHDAGEQQHADAARGGRRCGPRNGAVAAIATNSAPTTLPGERDRAGELAHVQQRSRGPTRAERQAHRQRQQRERSDAGKREERGVARADATASTASPRQYRTMTFSGASQSASRAISASSGATRQASGSSTSPSTAPPA